MDELLPAVSSKKSKVFASGNVGNADKQQLTLLGFQTTVNN
jgi:hypothetical protein